MLRDRNTPIAVEKNILVHGAVFDDSRGALRLLSVDAAIGQYDASRVHFRNRLDYARTTDTGYATAWYCVGEAGLVGPKLATDHLESWLEGLAIDTHAFYRAGSGSLTAGDLRTFKRRAGRARCRQQPVAVADQYFGIRAHVDDQ